MIVDFTAKHSILANETRPDVNTLKQAMETQLRTGRMGDLAANSNGFALSVQGVYQTMILWVTVNMVQSTIPCWKYIHT